MAKKATFECRYVQDWAYTKALYAHNKQHSLFLTIWWSAFTAIPLVLGVYNLKADNVLLGVLCLAASAYSLFRLLGDSTRLRRKWKKTCQLAGSDRIEACVTFSDHIQMKDSSGTDLYLHWADFEKLKLHDDGPYIRFSSLNKKEGSIYLPNSGFEDGTAEAFLAWMRKEHPVMFQNY